MQYLHKFMIKDIKRSDSVVKKLMEQRRYSALAPHLTALTKTRSIVIPVGRLSTECATFEEAVVVEVVSQISGEHPKKVMKEVRARELDFPQLCNELLAENNALIIVLDDVMDLVMSENTVRLQWLRSKALHIDSREQKTRAAMTLLQDLLVSVLEKPGALLYMTGRAPEATYKVLSTTYYASPIMSYAVLFDAFQQAHIEEILTQTCIAGTDVKLYEEIGLRNLEEVRDLAQWALFHTGGVPRVLAVALDVLQTGQYLKPGHRADNQSLRDVLTSPKVSYGIYNNVKNSVPHGIGLNLCELNNKTGWDPEISTASLLQVLDTAKDNTPVRWSMLVKVAEGKDVEAVDLLSVLGVPFKHNYCGDMTVQLGAWTIRAMLEEKTVAWTEAELRQQVHWMSEGTEGGTVELHRLGLAVMR